jgi:hypothetical protein
MDIKSHQTEAPFFPTEALVHGNTKVDLWCERARLLPMPDDVKIPSSPCIAFLCYQGRMITASPDTATRRILRDQATARMRLLLSTGKDCITRLFLLSPFPRAPYLHQHHNSSHMGLSAPPCRPPDSSGPLPCRLQDHQIDRWQLHRVTALRLGHPPQGVSMVHFPGHQHQNLPTMPPWPG